MPDSAKLPEGAAQAAHRYGKQFKDGRPFEKMHVDAATDFLAGVRWLQSQNTSQPKDAGDDARYNPVTEIESLDDAKRMYDAILGDNTSQAFDEGLARRIRLFLDQTPADSMANAGLNLITAVGLLQAVSRELGDANG